MIKNISLFALSLLMFQPLFAYEDFGVVGNTYEITEKDAFEEMKKAAEKIDTKELQLKVLESVKDAMQGKLNLPLCQRNNHIQKDISAIATQDIDIEEGDIHVKKGQKVENLNKALVSYIVLNLNQKDEIEYSKKKDIPPFVLVATGDMRDEKLSHFSERYVLSEELAGQLGITCTPSIIKVGNDSLSIDEIYLEREKKK